MRISSTRHFSVSVASSEARMLAMAVLFAALTGMGAVMRIPLSPVPVTMQVFFVLLSGLILGPVWGPASQLLYLLMGLSGAPFFAAPPHAGPAVLFGPSGGYLWGFAVAAGCAGWLSGRLWPHRRERTLRTLGDLIACLAGLGLIYACGVHWLGAWLSLHGKSPALAFQLGVKPFLLVDLVKAAAAALCANPATGRRGLSDLQ